MKPNKILSLCLSGHGFSGALCEDGIITVATTLERLTRVKNDSFPVRKSKKCFQFDKKDAELLKRIFW